MTTYTEIEKRWNERIVPNGWHTMGREGAAAYIKKYGKKMGEDKRQWFYCWANRQKCKEFAEGIRSIGSKVKPDKIARFKTKDGRYLKLKGADTGGAYYLTWHPYPTNGAATVVFGMPNGRARGDWQDVNNWEPLYLAGIKELLKLQAELNADERVVGNEVLGRFICGGVGLWGFVFKTKNAAELALHRINLAMKAADPRSGTYVP